MKDDRLYLVHIAERIERIRHYTKEGKDAFFADTKTQDAVIRNIEIIGEAVKNLSDALRSAHPNIPWKQIAGMRDKVIHDYFGVDLEIVWAAVEKDLPPLARAIHDLLRNG